MEDALAIVESTAGIVAPDCNVILFNALSVVALESVFPPALVGFTIKPICLKSLSVGKSPEPSAYSNRELTMT